MRGSDVSQGSERGSGRHSHDDFSATARDAARTRRRLLDVAFGMFARDGYARATTRAIADGAGVNVALISRYFGSKAGLFEACLEQAARDVVMPSRLGRSDVAGMIAAALAPERDSPRGEAFGTLMALLLRSSGDAQAERLRDSLLDGFSKDLAAGLDPGNRGANPDGSALLRSQLLVCLGMGLAIARGWNPGVEPLSSAPSEDVVKAVADIISALFPTD